MNIDLSDEYEFQSLWWTRIPLVNIDHSDEHGSKMMNMDLINMDDEHGSWWWIWNDEHGSKMMNIDLKMMNMDLKMMNMDLIMDLKMMNMNLNLDAGA